MCFKLEFDHKLLKNTKIENYLVSRFIYIYDKS